MKPEEIARLILWLLIEEGLRRRLSAFRPQVLPPQERFPGVHLLADSAVRCGHGLHPREHAAGLGLEPLVTTGAEQRLHRFAAGGLVESGEVADDVADFGGADDPVILGGGFGQLALLLPPGVGGLPKILPWSRTRPACGS